MIPYTAILDVSRELVWRVSRLLAAERRDRGTRHNTRALTCYKQAVLVLRHVREDTDAPTLARDNAIGRSTAYRYIDEGITVLAEQAPDLEEALQGVDTSHQERIILDGKLFPSDCCGEKNETSDADAWFSGHKHRHGANIQFLANARGQPLWVSDGEPGSVADITAARLHVLPTLRNAARAGTDVLADAGYEGAGAEIRLPVKRPPEVTPQRLHVDTRAYNALLRGMRSLGERAMALLTQRWRLLQHTTKSPSRIGDLAKAAPVLTHLERRQTP